MAKETTNIGLKRFNGRNLHLLFIFVAIIGAILIFRPYTEKISNDEEQLAFGYAIFSVAGVYVGRYLSALWLGRHQIVPDRLYILFVSLILASATLLFLHMEYPLRSRTSINLFLSIIPLSFLSISVGVLIKLVRTSIQRQVTDATVSAEQSRSELRFLQSQLSPHFLFNTLNNLYGISITRHERIPALLLKLSDLLRYSVYEGKEPFVPLVDEMNYIRNYIDFEKLRIGDRLEMSTDIEEVTNPTIRIAPLVLIVFIENAFKHAKNTVDQKINIDLNLKISGSHIVFNIGNSYTASNSAANAARTAGTNGIGLANTVKRLDLLYGSEYELGNTSENGFYHVMLRLPIK
jgi:hypothetical protein